MAADIVPGNNGSSPFGLTVFDGRLYFSADDGIVGRELWSLSDALGINSSEEKSSSFAYPNPNNGQFTLNLNSKENCQVEAFNALGQVVLSRQYNSTDRASIELPNAGIYHLVIRTDREVYTEKIVMQ